jgi:hypothetical protein
VKGIAAVDVVASTVVIMVATTAGSMRSVGSAGQIENPEDGVMIFSASDNPSMDTTPLP